MSDLDHSAVIFKIKTTIHSLSDEDGFNHYRTRKMVSESFSFSDLEGDVRGTVLMLMDLPDELRNKVVVGGVESLDHLPQNFTKVRLFGAVFMPLDGIILPSQHGVAQWFATIKLVSDGDPLAFFS